MIQIKYYSFRLLPMIFCICALSAYCKAGQGMEFVLDMVHNNPGEPPYITKYNDPAYLHLKGFTGAVTHWHVNCGIDYSNTEPGLVSGDEERWIKQHAEKIDSCLSEFVKHGVKVYPFTDFVVFPKSIWDKYGNQLGDVATHKPNINNPITQRLIREQIDEIFNRFPNLDGLTLRFGETYLHDTPWHLGNSPIGENEIEDHVTLINLLRDEICEKRGKVLFYRTWDFGYKFHNSPEYYLAITDKIVPHEKLLFSIKYQQDDYHRMTPFNPTLGIGKHRQIVESQSRMEAYGKGAHPYYVASGVINGWPETINEIEFGTHRFTGRALPVNYPRGVADVLDSELISGVMTWSNGGGWQGPYIKHEIWTDINTLVMSKWAQNPEKSEYELFNQTCEELGFSVSDTKIIREIAELSIEGVRKGQLNSYVSNDVWWSRDEFFNVAQCRKSITEAYQRNLMDSILEEKNEAVNIWNRIEQLSKIIVCKEDSVMREAIVVSCTYGRIKYELINKMWTLMSEKYLNDTCGNYDKNKVAKILSDYEHLWIEWRDLERNSDLCATLYTEMAFRNKNEDSIGELVNWFRTNLQSDSKTNPNH